MGVEAEVVLLSILLKMPSIFFFHLFSITLIL